MIGRNIGVDQSGVEAERLEDRLIKAGTILKALESTHPNTSTEATGALVNQNQTWDMDDLERATQFQLK